MSVLFSLVLQTKNFVERDFILSKHTEI